MNRGALLLLAAGGVGISLSPVFVKLAAREGLGPTSIAFWRLALGAVPLFALAAWRGRGRRLGLSRPLLGLAALAGVIFTADLFLWHRAIGLVGAGLATILGNTQVFNTALLAWLVFGERPGGAFFAAAALGLAGVVLLAGGGAATGGDHLRGVLFGVGTGMAYAGYLTTTRAMTRRPDRPPMLTVVAWLSLLGAAASLAVCGLEDDMFRPPNAAAWLWLASLGVVVQAAAWWAIATALPQVPGATSGLVLLLQPVLATVWGRVLFHETLRPAQLVGAALTLTAIYLGTLGAARRPRGAGPQASRS